MRFTAIGLGACVLLSIIGGAKSQWQKYQPTERMQDPQLLKYNLRQMANGFGSVLSNGRLSSNNLMQFKDFVTVENPPTKVKANYTLRVKYQCSKPLVVIVFMEGDFLRLREPKVNRSIPIYSDADIVFFRKYWPCERSLMESRVELPLTFPQELLQRPNIALPKVWTMKTVNLKVAMVDRDLWDYVVNAKNLLRDIYHIGFDRAHQSMTLRLKNEHPYCRPESGFGRSFTWPYQMYNSLFEKNPPKSVPDDASVSLLNYPVVSSKWQFGMPRNFLPFKNPELRLFNPTKHPRCTFSFMMYVASKCDGLCAIFQHMDDEEKYASPVIFLNNKNQVQVQARVADNNSYAMSSPWTVPIQEWFRLDVQQYNSVVNVSMRYGKNFSEYEYMLRSFHLPVDLDYAAGFFTVGSSMFARNFHGIIGSARIWRNILITSDEINLPPPDHVMFKLGVDELLKQSEETEKMVKRRWDFLESEKLNRTDNTKLDICIPYFIELIQPPKKELLEMCPVESRPLPHRYRHIESQLIKRSNRKKKDGVSLTKIVGDRLLKKAKRLLDDRDRITSMDTVIEILENASGLLHGPSLFLMYVIYANGFGTSSDLEAARKYLHTGALVGDKMCVKTLGYKHTTGGDGLPADLDVAIYYYFSAGFAAQEDRQLHMEGMAEVNRIRLTDERQLKQQTSEDEDLFQWFKHQAGTGLHEAKRNLAQLLYWGKQGLKRNLKAAFEYYEQAAKDTDDPLALYDYGLTLMQGHGTEVNEERGLEVLQQAAEKESPHAYNTLGWYYMHQKDDKEKAVEYFEKADEMDNVDAAYNLGHMHHLGDYPGKKRDMKKAFHYYYKAATRGHVESSNRIAYIFASGIRDFLYRNLHSACLFSKAVAELSPVMGEIIREAIQAFRSQSWTKATLLYLAAAESGFEIAGYNTAFLIEEDKSNQIRDNIERDSVWRFWNASTRIFIAVPYALNRMGDYFYYGIDDKEDLDKAIKFYIRAASANDPQNPWSLESGLTSEQTRFHPVCFSLNDIPHMPFYKPYAVTGTDAYIQKAIFNLACILEEHGDRVDNETLKLLGLPESSLQRREDTILELYQKCSNIGSEANSMPCYMGLIRMKGIVMWKYSSFLTKVAATIFAVGASTLLIFASTLLRHQRQTDSVVLTEQGSVEEAPGAIRTHILQEEIIEHEVTRERKLSERGRQRNHSADANGSVVNDKMSLTDSIEDDASVGRGGKSMLEESSEDEDEEVKENGVVAAVHHEFVNHIIDEHDSAVEEDEETGEFKKSVEV